MYPRWAGALILLLILTTTVPVSWAAPANQTQIKKNILQNKKDLAAIEKKLREERRKKLLAQLKEKSVLSRLQKLDQAMGRLRREKEANQQDLLETRSRMDRLHREAAANKEELVHSRQLLKQRLRALYRMSFLRPFLGGVLDSENFGDLARKLKFELLLAESNQKIVSQTLRHEERLERDFDQWSQEERRKTRILAVVGRQERNYSVEKKRRALFLTSVQREQTLREQTIDELSDTARELQQKVALFLRQAEDAKKRSTWVSTGAGLMVKRGKIPWPVSGTVISPFGKYKNPEFNAVVENNGIQIQAPTGTPFRAVAGGRVRFADWFKGYGKLVILDHGEGYYSLYAQASELNVSEGQEVVSGQVLGTVGDTSSLVGSSLYFEIRHNGVPKDPFRWLQHRS